MGIKWAPLMGIEWQRRLEVFSAFTYIGIILFAEILSLALFILIFLYGGIIGKSACVMYLVYFYQDRNADGNCSRGQGNEAMRNWVIWRHFTNYFPSILVKTVDLSPKRNYIFAVFPHGILSCGAFGHFVTSTTNFRELFPGIRSKLCTLTYHFFVPLFREIALGWGMMSARKSSIITALTQSNGINAPHNADGYTSNAIVLMVGGAHEALNARPGIYQLVLKKRKGFIKVALKTGAPLVPVFSFNEVEVFDQPSNEPGTFIRKFQDFVKSVTGIAPAIFIGRGFLQYSFGFIPRRQRITTVVGAPLEAEQTNTPTKKQIDDLHEKFTNALNQLFEDHKHKYLKNADKIRLIIE